MTQFLKCGCAANATHHNAHDGLKEGHPSCVIHDCCEIIEEPDLSTRQARCMYFGRSFGSDNECLFEQRDLKSGICNCQRQSSTDLPFFEHKPNEDYDKFYCGCQNWN